jgi:hypothetical protein
MEREIISMMKSISEKCVFTIQESEIWFIFISVDIDRPKQVEFFTEIITSSKRGGFRMSCPPQFMALAEFIILTDYLEEFSAVKDIDKSPPYEFLPLELAFKVYVMPSNQEGEFELRFMVNLRTLGESGLESIFVGIEATAKDEQCKIFISDMKRIINNITDLQNKLAL